MSLSAISIHRNRSQHCHEAAAQSKLSFVCSWPLVTHFDGKLLSSVAGWPGIDDHVAVIAIGHEMQKSKVFKELMNK